MVFSIVILLNAAAFFFLTTHGESLQLSYLMPFLTENAKEAVGEVVGFIPPHVTLNSAALWVACKRPEETTALSIIKASVHNACPGAISAALAWTFLEFFASKVLSGIFEEGTFFGEVMLGILRTSVKHAESARDEAAGDESSSTVSILLNSFLLIYLFTHPIFFFLLFGVVKTDTPLTLRRDRQPSSLTRGKRAGLAVAAQLSSLPFSVPGTERVGQSDDTGR